MSGFLKLWKMLTSIEGNILDKLLPGFSLLYIIIGLIGSVFESIRTINMAPFIHSLSTSLFAIDFGIWEQVQIALVTPEKFGFVNIFIIFSALTVFLFLIKCIEKLLSFLMTNESAKGLGTFLIAFLILGTIEFVSVLATHQKLIFPGIGFFSLLWNLPTIFNVIAINWSAFKVNMMRI